MDNKENNSPLSGERVEETTLSEIMFRYIERQPKDFGNGMTERCFPVTAIVDIVTEHEAPFKSRISDLEAENAKLREALEKCKDYLKDRDSTKYSWADRLLFIEQAQQALKGKETKGE